MSTEAAKRAAVIGGALLALLGPSTLGAAAPAGGGEQWQARLGGPFGESSGGMALSPDGDTLYVGAVNGRLTVAAYDAVGGTEQWIAQVGDPRVSVFTKAITVSPNGALVFVTGDTQESLDTRSFVTVALDAATGEPVWRSRESVGTGNEAIPNSIAASPDGGQIYVTGSRTGSGGIDDFWDYFTVAYHGSTGTKLWTATYRGPGAAADVAEGVEVDPTGARVYVTGTSMGASSRDFGTIAYDADNGTQLWQARIGTAADDYAVDLAVDPDGGRLYVTGTAGTFTGSQDYLTVAYDTATGARLSTARFDSGRADSAAAIAVAPNSTLVYVTGTGGDDFATVAYSTATGRRVWTAQTGRPGFSDDSAAMAIAPDGGKLYVTGSSQNGRVSCFGDVASTDYATVGYNALTGAKLWQARYPGLAAEHPDIAAAVAVGNDGSSVFVTGTSDDGCSSSDVATISYEG